MRRSLGKAGVSQRRTIREFAAVEAMPAYSKRTGQHGGIERDIILKQMNCGVAEDADVRKLRGSPIRV